MRATGSGARVYFFAVYWREISSEFDATKETGVHYAHLLSPSPLVAREQRDEIFHFEAIGDIINLRRTGCMSKEHGFNQCGRERWMLDPHGRI